MSISELRSSTMYYMDKFASSYFENGGAVYSSKKLRKALKVVYRKSPSDRTYIDMADIFGYIFEVSFCKAKKRELDLHGFVEIKTKVIADAISLPEKRIRKITDCLVEAGLINVRKLRG